jgi:hypothetical protein
MASLIAVIGHGPSLQGSGLGEYIDSFKYVIRFPRLGDWQSPLDYGVKTSFFCAAKGKIMARIMEEKPEIGYYLWEKHFGYSMPGMVCRHLGIKKYEDVSRLIQKWARKLPKPFQNLSSGTAGTLIAAAKLGGNITVFGCDHLKIGKDMREDYIGSWFYEGRVSTREKIMKTGAHALGEERKLIDEMAQEYRVKIDFN